MISDIESFFATQRVLGAVVPVFAADPTVTPLGGLLSKACAKCGEEKPLEAFHRCKHTRDGRQSWCSVCKAAAQRHWQHTPVGRASMAVYKRRYRQTVAGRSREADYRRRYWQTPEGRAKKAKADRRYRQTPEGRAKKAESRRRWLESPENRAKQAKAIRRWRQTPEGRAKHWEGTRRWRETPEGRGKYDEASRRYQKSLRGRSKRSARRRHLWQTSPQYRLATALRSRLNSALKGVAKSARTLDLLGCTLEHLIKHLESRFLPGMSWDNQGEWHVDHIRPLSLFDLTDPAQQRVACHWTNLQPLWAAENIRKSNKLEQPCHYQFIPCTLPLL